MSSRSQSQLNLPPSLLAERKQEADQRANDTRDTALLPKETQDDAHALAAEMFDQALTGARITSDEAAYLLGISPSLVRRMRSKDARERVSSVQLLKLGPAFLIEWHHAMDRRFGFGRAALGRLLEAAGTLALGLRA